MGSETLFYQKDIFEYIPIKILQKPSLFNPFKKWKVEVEGKVFEFPWKVSKDEIIHLLEQSGVLKRENFVIFDFCGYRVLSSKREGTYIYSPYSGNTYFISTEFVKFKTQMAEVIIDNIHKIFDKKERDSIYLCAKKVLKHPYEVRVVSYAYS